LRLHDFRKETHTQAERERGGEKKKIKCLAAATKTERLLGAEVEKEKKTAHMGVRGGKVVPDELGKRGNNKR